MSEFRYAIRLTKSASALVNSVGITPAVNPVTTKALGVKTDSLRYASAVTPALRVPALVPIPISPGPTGLGLWAAEVTEWHPPQPFELNTTCPLTASPVPGVVVVGDVVVVAAVVAVGGAVVAVAGLVVAVGVGSSPPLHAAPTSAIAAVANIRPLTIFSLFISNLL